MLTIDALKAFGANADEGLNRCMNNEAFYFRLIGMALEDKGFGALADALAAGDVKAGFEAAHALKGVLGNLSLTPLYESVSEITEKLRAGSDEGCDELLADVEKKRQELLALCDK